LLLDPNYHDKGKYAKDSQNFPSPPLLLFFFFLAEEFSSNLSLPPSSNYRAKLFKLILELLRLFD